MFVIVSLARTKVLQKSLFFQAWPWRILDVIRGQKKSYTGLSPTVRHNLWVNKFMATAQ